MSDHIPTRDASSPGQDRRRLLRAFNVSLAFVLVLLVVYSAQSDLDLRRLSVAPHDLSSWPGLLTAPLLHGSFEHLAANAGALLILGTLAGSVYPRATRWALPLMWLGSGIGAWLLGEAGSHHLGASGVTHGLLFMVGTLGLLRRDRASIAAAMIGFLFYGGMLMTVLPNEPGISWQSHLGGAVGGLLAGLLFRRLDPLPPRQRYSWEDEDEDEDATRANEERDELEPPAPATVPVLWRRDERDSARGVVLRFPPRRPPATPEQRHD